MRTERKIFSVTLTGCRAAWSIAEDDNIIYGPNSTTEDYYDLHSFRLSLLYML